MSRKNMQRYFEMKNMIKDFLPESVKKPLRQILGLRELIIIYLQPRRHRVALRKLHKKERVKVAFFAIHSAVWKYDGVYQLMDKDPRFEPMVIVCPVVNYGKENMLSEMDNAYKMFKNKGYNVIKSYNEKDDTYLDVKKEINPDIIFYTNPHRLTKEKYYIAHYKNTLSCYVPYSFHITHLNEIQYNQLFHNILWKAFYETEMHKKIAKAYSKNKGLNVVVTGYPNIDNFEYGCRTGKDIWKDPNVSLMRIIWAPHHSIDSREDLSYSNFLYYHQAMLDILKKYKDKIQVAFKPHPLLREKLLDHKDWGKKRTDDYYGKWASSENAQLETMDYVDLFNSSDALIFDSASFMVEYLCCGKPSLFTLSDSNVKDRFNEFGKMAFEQHYHAYNELDIYNFIENVVCENKDKMKKNRETFYARYLIPPNNKTASENIYNEVCKELFGITNLIS
jgi:hypothetical protein